MYQFGMSEPGFGGILRIIRK